MHKFEFSPDDLFTNTLKTYPEYNVFLYQGQMFVNKETRISGSGGITVYDINSNRTDSPVYPLVMSSSEKNALKSHRYQPLVQNYSGDFFHISKYAEETTSDSKDSFYGESFVNVAGQGALTGAYGFESPIKRNLTQASTSFTRTYYDLNRNSVVTATNNYKTQVNISASALHNVAKKYVFLSDHFVFTSSSVRSRDLVYDNSPINFITIPSMYYGSTIKKGSVELNYYITGSKVGACADIRHNGILIGTTGSTSGSVVGVVLYDEGIIMLTSSAQLEDNSIQYNGSATTGSWLHYGTTLNDGISHSTLASASYDLNFKGVNYITSMTMFAHARKGHLNHSNNPTYRSKTAVGASVLSSSTSFAESSYNINNIVSGSFVSASFEKTTYISKVHIYDEDGNLIAITSLAKPMRKRLEDEFSIKMKIDL